VADLRELVRRCTPCAPCVARRLDALPQLMEVDHDGDALRGAAGGGLGRSGYAEPRRRENDDGEAGGVPEHDGQARQLVRASRPGAAWDVARRHWSRVVLSMPLFSAAVIAALS